VGPRGGDLEGPTGDRLASHLGEVGDRRRSNPRERRCGHRGEGSLAEQVPQYLGEVGDPYHPAAAEGRRFGGIGRRQDQLTAATRCRELGQGERAAHRPERAVEPELAAEQAVAHGILGEQLVADQHAESYREVEVVALLP
jgi:hypothetical protein